MYDARAVNATATPTAAATRAPRRTRKLFPRSQPVTASFLGGLAQHVTHAPHGVDQAGLAARPGPAPQIADVDPEGIGGGAEVVAPHPVEDKLAGEDLPGVWNEQLAEEGLRA